MKALVLAGGRGKRLEDLTRDTNKCMLNIAGIPLIEYSLRNIVKIPEIDRIVIVVGFMAETITDRYGEEFEGKPIEYSHQEEQKGLVHAMECSVPLLGADDFFLFLGDEVILNARHHEMVERFKRGDVDIVCGVKTVEDTSLISRTYTITSDSNGFIQKLVEKPETPFNNIMGTGNCIFRNRTLSFIEKTPINPIRGERELPDLIQCVVNEGCRVTYNEVGSYYTNLNSRDEVNQLEKELKKKN